MSRKPIIINDVDVSECEFYINSKNLEFNCKQTPQSYFCKNQPNCYYKQLKRKEEECEELKSVRYSWMSKCEQETKMKEFYQDVLDELKAENKKMEKGYIELTEIVAPYIDDFTGYNEELGGFDIVLCIKELMQQLDQLKEEVEKQRALKQTYLTCYKTKHGDVKGKLFKYERYKEALQNIKRIIEVNKVELEECLVHDIDDQILQKISEVIPDEQV